MHRNFLRLALLGTLGASPLIGTAGAQSPDTNAAGTTGPGEAQPPFPAQAPSPAQAPAPAGTPGSTMPSTTPPPFEPAQPGTATNDTNGKGEPSPGSATGAPMPVTGTGGTGVPGRPAGTGGTSTPPSDPGRNAPAPGNSTTAPGRSMTAPAPGTTGFLDNDTDSPTGSGSPKGTGPQLRPPIAPAIPGAGNGVPHNAGSTVAEQR